MLALDPATVAALRDHLVVQEGGQEIVGVRYLDSVLSSPGPTVDPIHPARFSQWFQQHVVAAGLQGDQLRRPEVASAIIGATRPEQVHAIAKASSIQLTLDTLAAIEAALGDTPVTQPTLAPLAHPGVTHR